MSSDDWAILNEIVEILELIKSFMKRLEGRLDYNKLDRISDIYLAITIILT